MHLNAAEFEYFQETLWSNKIYSDKVSKLLVDNFNSNLSKFKKRRIKQIKVKKLTDMLINENSGLIKGYGKGITAVIQYLGLFFNGYVGIDMVINAVRKVENNGYKKSLGIEDITFIPEIEERILKIDNIMGQICNYKGGITNFVLLILEFQDIFSQGIQNNFDTKSWLSDMCDEYVNMKMSDLYFEVNDNQLKYSSKRKKTIVDTQGDKIDSIDKIKQIAINHEQINEDQLNSFFLPNSISTINGIAQDYLNMIKGLVMILDISCIGGNFEKVGETFRKGMKSLIRYKEFYGIQNIKFLPDIEKRITLIDNILYKIVNFEGSLSKLCLLIIKFYELILGSGSERFKEMYEGNLLPLYNESKELEREGIVQIILK